MRNFTSEDIKDLLESPRQSIVKEWEEFYQNQLNSLGQQANEGEPFAKRFLSDLGSVDFQVNQLIENNKVLSDYDYSIKQLDKELNIVKNGLPADLSKLAKDTTFPYTLDSIYEKSSNMEDYNDSLYIESIIYSNPNISNELINKVSDLYLKNGFNYQYDYSLEKLIKNPSLTSEQVQPLNKLFQKEKDYFEQEENSRDKANALAGDMDYLAAKFEETNDKPIDYEYEMTFELASKSKDVNVLEELSKSESWSIRAAVADNESTPSYILESLSKDEDNTVKYSVARNPNSSKEILSELALDNDEYISSKALEKLDSLNINLKDTIEQASNYSIDESTNSNKNNYKHR